MKKNILLAILIASAAAANAQTSCTPAGINTFYPAKTAFRNGYFSSPYDNVDSIGCMSVAFGYNTRPRGYASVAFGNNAMAYADYTLSSGSYTIASGQNSLATGYNTIASNSNTSSFGYQSIASGNGAFASGYITKAAADYAHSMGVNTQANGYASTATGSYSIANGEASLAGGFHATAGGLRSFAFGEYSQASGNSSVAIGSNTTASGINAFAMGYYSTASGNYSFVYGDGAEARASSSVAMGYGTLAKARTGFAIGSYNDSTDNPDPLAFGTTDRLFQVGNGINQSSRYNALTILRNGNTGIGVLNPVQRLEVAGNISSTGNLTVQNGKGMIRSNDGTQQKKLASSVLVSGSFAAGQTRTFTVTWSETFGASPDAFVGNTTGGAGGWAEVVMTLGATSTSGVTLYVYNPKTTAVNPSFTVKVIGIGPQ